METEQDGSLIKKNGISKFRVCVFRLSVTDDGPANFEDILLPNWPIRNPSYILLTDYIIQSHRYTTAQ